MKMELKEYRQDSSYIIEFQFDEEIRESDEVRLDFKKSFLKSECHKR